ncbi:MAG: hypothetical protein ACREJM_05885 [Candidatus Saccharimonadales bacterium]
MLAAYEAREIPAAYLEPIVVGDALPSMPLFLQPSWYIEAPLEETYQRAFRGVPEFGRWVVEAK